MKIQFSGKSGNTQESSDDSVVQIQIPHWPLLLIIGIVSLVGVLAAFS